ncbi:MAG: response regulator [Planctomycetia bacterium]|nr:response regulator [Planctomycetia bacterium]
MLAETLKQPTPQFAPVGHRQSILVVDDDEALADVLSRRLSQQGFATKTAESGAEGLALARSGHPDLILLDLRLPDTDGFAICEELADSAETCNIPIIILSGMEQPDIIRRSRLAGCHYFVRKPYDPNALLVLIRQAIEEANGWNTDGDI